MELVGTDARFKYWASCGACARYPVVVARLEGDRVAVVSREMPDRLAVERESLLKELATCPEEPLAWGTCESGPLAAIFAMSLSLGDWESVKRDARLRPASVARIEECRAIVQRAVDDLEAPLESCHVFVP
jgi:hypothetical protein